MKLTSRAGRRLAVGITLACSAILLPAAALASPAAPGTPCHPAAAVLPVVSSASGAAAHPRQRQLAVTTLSSLVRSPARAVRYTTFGVCGPRH